MPVFELPINADTLPFAVDTGGTLHLKTLRDIVEGEPFDPQEARGPDALIQIEVESDYALALTQALGIQLELEAGATLDIVWPEGDERALIDEFGLPQTQTYLVFNGHGKAQVGAGISFPTGPLQTTLGAKAGGEMDYVYVCPVKPERPAGEVLRSFFRSMRLPHHLVGATPAGGADRLPVDGEVIRLGYSGYLHLNAETTWGYEVGVSKQAEIGDLSVSTKAQVTAAAKLGTSFKIAGEWNVEARKGQKAGWVRLQVRKQQNRTVGVLADLAVKADIETTGLPSRAGEFLEAALGFHTPDVLERVLAQVESGDDLLALVQQKADGLAERFVTKLADRLHDSVLTSEIATKVFEALQTADEAYRDLEKIAERVEANPLAVVEEYADDIEVVRRALDAVDTADDRAALLDRVTDSEVWELLRLFLGDRFMGAITSDEAFAKVREELEAFARSGWEALAEVVAARKEALGLDGLLGDLDKLLDNLDAINTPEKLKAKAEQELLDLIKALTDTAFDTLSKTKLNKELKDLQAMVRQLTEAGKSLYASFERALQSSYALELSASYSRATSKDALVDVEFNLRKAGGVGRFKSALAGKFDDALAAYDASELRVHPSRFTHAVHTSSRLRVNLFGWESSTLKEFVFKTEQVVREQGGGLLHLYTFSGENRETQTRRDEETKMSFLFQLFAESASPAVIDSITRMTVDYAYEVSDESTTEAELREYLLLAYRLGILPGTVDDTVRQLRADLGVTGSKWGTVQAAYHVSYRPAALLDLFRYDLGPDAMTVVRTTFRTVLANHFLWYANLNRSRPYDVLSEAIQSGGLYWKWKQEGDDYFQLFQMNQREYPIADPATGEVRLVPMTRPVRQWVWRCFQSEDAYVRALQALDRVLDDARIGRVDPIPADLEGVLKEFIECGNELRERSGVRTGAFGGLGAGTTYADPFFSIFDQLIAFTGRPGARSATLELKLKPGDESVTRMYAT